jgi:hypothetical protein
MTIGIDLKPEVQAELGSQAAAHGVDIGAWAASQIPLLPGESLVPRESISGSRLMASGEACPLESNISLRISKNDDPQHATIGHALHVPIGQRVRLCNTSQTVGTASA